MRSVFRVVLSSFIVLGAISIIGGSVASAATDTCTWTGSVSSSFANAANWTGCDNGNVPESSDTIIFPNSALNKTVYKDTPHNYSPSRINVTGDNYIFNGDASPNELKVFLMYVTGSNNTFNGPIKTDRAGNIVTEFLGTGNVVNGDIELVSTIDLGPWRIEGSGVVVNSDITGAKGSIRIDVTGEVEFNGNNTFDPALAVGGFSAPTSLPITLRGGVLVCRSFTCTGAGDLNDNDYPDDGTGKIRFDVDAIVTGKVLSANTTLRTYIELSEGVNVELAGGIEYVSYSPGGQFAVDLADNSTLEISGDIIMPTNESLQFIGSPNESATVIISGGNITTPAAHVSASNVRITYANSAPALSTTLVVEAGAKLGGTDPVGDVLVHTGGFVAPGNSPGCLTTGAITMGGTLEIELAGTTVCTQYDQLNVTGAADITGAFLVVDTQFSPVDGDQFTVMTSTALTGIFTGLPEGTVFTAGVGTYSISYTSTDVVLTAVAAPVVAPPAAPTPPESSEALAETGTTNTSLVVLVGATLLLASMATYKVSKRS